MKKHLPLVSAIVINYNGKKFLKGIFTSLRKQSYKPLEIIFMENGSTDGSYEYVKKNFPEVKIIRAEKNLGYSEGNNVAVRHAKGRYVVLLNNDLKVHRAWLVELMDFMQKTKAVIVGSRIQNLGEFYHKSLSTGSLMSLFGEPVDLKAKDPTITFFASGCSMLFDKKIIGEPFPKEYFAYSEDAYAGWKARLMGYDVRINPKSKVDHYGGHVREQLPKLMEFHGEKNRLANLLIFFELKNLLKLSPLLAVHVLFVLLVSVPKGRLFTRLNSYWWIIKNLPLVLRRRKEMQSIRKVSDKEILKYFTCEIPYIFHGMEKIIKALLKFYCMVFMLKVYELGDAHFKKAF